MMSRYAIILVLVTALLQALIVSSAAAQPYVPLNAQPRLAGPGWECLDGFKRVGERCQRIIVPVNAVLTIDGRGWRCLDGFRRKAEHCERIGVPANAAMSVSTPGWLCFDGYRKTGQSCRRMGTPVSADSRPARSCPRGHRNLNDRCVPFLPPSNAAYADNADGWVCVAGYRRIKNGCRKLSDQERAAIARTVPGYGGTEISLASLMQDCAVIDGEGRYARLSCEGVVYNSIERGCFAAAAIVSGREGDGIAIKCPSPGFSVIAENCVVTGSSALNGSGGALQCFGRHDGNEPGDGLADALPGADGRG